MLGTASLLGSLLLASSSGDSGLMSDAASRALLARLTESEAFVGSSEERESRRSAARSFSGQEYGRLRGNPLLGYWDVGTFTWTGGARLAWGGIRSIHPSAKGIRPAAWATAFRQVAARHGLAIAPGAGVRLEGACVAAVVDATPQEPVPGVLLELRLKSDTGTLLYRVAMGKASVEDAMGASLDLVIEFARNVSATSTGGQRGTSR